MINSQLELNKLLTNKNIRICQAVRREKDIKWLRTSVKRDLEKTDIRKNNAVERS